MGISPQAASAAVGGASRRRRLLGALAGAGLGGLLWALPTPAGLTATGHAVIAVLALTVVFWVCGVLGNAVTGLLMLGLMLLAGVQPQHALGAYASAPFWTLLVVLFYGFAMQSTGLARRLSFLLLSRFPPTYKGLLAAFFVIGLILSLGIPSMTVRTAILVPIAWALAQAIGLRPGSRGCSLFLLSVVEMAVIPGCATLYGSLWGPVMVQLFATQGYTLEWLAYARAFALPTLLWSALLLVGNWVALRPEGELPVDREFSRRELARMGRVSRDELLTAAVIGLSVLYWVAEQWHHQPPYVVGLFGLVAFAAFGILKESDFGGAVSWPFVLFLGAVYALPVMIQQNGVSDWLGRFIVPLIQTVSGNALALVLALAVGMLLLKFTDPAGFLAMTVLFLPVSAILRQGPLSPLVIMAPLLFAGHPFWAVYQNFWIAMLEGMTDGQGCTPAHRLRLANVYAVVTLLALALSVPYWWALGLLG